MPVDASFLELLICPATRQPLQPLADARREALNAGIIAGRVKTCEGRRVELPLDDALTTADLSRAYPVRDGIPLLLVEEAILLAEMAQGKVPQTKGSTA